MTSVSSPGRRQALRWASAATAVGVLPLPLRAATTVRYILSIPTMSPAVANQTSIPKVLGFYDQENLRVEPVLAGAGGITGAVQLVAKGDQDIGSGSYTPVMARAAAGQDLGLSFFYEQIRVYPTEVAVLADHPARSIVDLKGKLIGVPTLANEGVAMVRYAARDAGLNPATDIRLIAVGSGAQAGQALRSEQVDAYVAPRSQIKQLESLGITLRPLPNPPRFKDLFGACLFARRDYIARNHKTVVGVGRAVAKSTVFLINNPEAAIRLHWKVYPEQVPQGVAPEKALQDSLRVMRAQIEGLSFQEGDTVRKFGYFRPQSVAALLDVFGWNAIQNPSDFFTNDLIEEINSFDAAKIAEQARNYRVG